MSRRGHPQKLRKMSMEERVRRELKRLRTHRKAKLWEKQTVVKKP
jgi:hypothetical protein